MLSFETLGSENAEPLIFLHGLGAGKSQTTSALTELSDHRVIAPDLPGHGDSTDFDPSKFSFNYFADLVIELMDHLGIEKTNLGGLSMGSGISLNIALRYPDRVKKLVLLRPSWLDSPQPAHLAFAAKPAWQTEEEFSSDPDFQALLSENPPVAQSVLALYQRSDNRVLEKMWNDCPFSSFEDLGNVSHLALVLDSPRDELHPAEVALKIHNALPNSELHHLPARYHEPAAYQESLNQHLNTFLK
ncbi:MAG: alpha/beta fold hydrolase [Akkermansiaceae bacterium]